MSVNEIKLISDNFIGTYNRLKAQQQYVEKICTGMMASLKHVLTPEVLNLNQHLETIRREQSRTIEQQLIRIVSARKRLKHEVSDKNKLRQLDMTYFKNSILDIEKNISLLKACTTLEVDRLQADEASLNLEINRVKAHLNACHNKKINFVQSKVGRSISAHCNSKEVSDYLHYVYQCGGHDGGWSAEDHKLFLRYYKKYENNTPSLITHLGMVFPDITEAEIEAHIDWFKNYTAKKERYKHAALEWRSKRQENRPRSSSKIKSAPILRSTTQPIRIPAEIREKITRWKSEKQRKLDEEKQRLQKESIKLKNQENSLNSRRYETKERVEVWKVNKISAENAKREKREMEEMREKELRAFQAKRLIREYQSQDKLYIDRRREINAEKNKPMVVRSRSSTLVQVGRDPERVMRATKQWIEKTKPREAHPKIQNTPLNINNMPRLAKPEWMCKLPQL